MSKGNIFGDIVGEVLEQGGSVVGQTAKQIIKTPADLAKTAGGQINPTQSSQDNQMDKNKTSQDQKNSDTQKASEDIVKNLYGKTDDKNTDLKPQENLQKTTNEHPEKTPEELQKIEKLKQELHQTTYYQPLINPQKQEEERPAEKVEREEQQEEQKKLEEIKEEEKKVPLAVERAERKTEMFRGVSG